MHLWFKWDGHPCVRFQVNNVGRMEELFWPLRDTTTLTKTLPLTSCYIISINTRENTIQYVAVYTLDGRLRANVSEI